MANDGQPIPLFPRSIRPAPDPLGLYIGVARNDHRELMNLISAGKAACFGAVFDPTNLKRHAELLALVLGHKLDAIFDPRTQQSALPGSYTEQLGSLPWGVGRQNGFDDFVGVAADERIAAMGDFILQHGFTEALSPSHLLQSADDQWLQIDVRLASLLRKRLDQTGGKRIPLIYSLAMPYSALRNHQERQLIIEALEGIPVEAIWLKIDGLGANSTSTAARNYIEAAGDFHELGIPIVADRMGGIFGEALMAFGAVSGVAHGITFGERFDASDWRKPRQEGGFSPARRIYFASLDMMLTRDQAELLLHSSSRARALFGCRDTSCCPRGTHDLLESPGRHFLIQRTEELSALSQIPESLRPQQFLDSRLRPATDRAVAAAAIPWEDQTMAKKTLENRKRLDSLRVALGDLAAKTRRRSFARLPETRAARDAHSSIR